MREASTGDAVPLSASGSPGEKAGGSGVPCPYVSRQEAGRLGLKVSSVRSARVEPHRDGSVFFIQELVEYDDGRLGWRRRGGISSAGRPYTEKYVTSSQAEAAIATQTATRLAEAVDSSAARPRRLTHVERQVLQELALWELRRAPSMTVGELESLVTEMETVVGAALVAIKRAKVRPAPSSADLQRLFVKDIRSWKELADSVIERFRADQQAKAEAAAKAAERAGLITDAQDAYLSGAFGIKLPRDTAREDASALLDNLTYAKRRPRLEAAQKYLADMSALAASGASAKDLLALELAEPWQTYFDLDWDYVPPADPNARERPDNTYWDRHSTVSGAVGISVHPGTYNVI